LLVRYQHERDEAFRCELEPVAGAGETVERIMGAGIKVCVASQGALAKMRLTLALTGLEHHFPDGGRFSAEAVPRGKPFPDLFLHAASTMEVSPAECVVVEDTPTGVTAARAAGMHVVGLAADSDEASLRAADAEIIHSLAELPSLPEPRLSPAAPGSALTTRWTCRHRARAHARLRAHGITSAAREGTAWRSMGWIR
jgi:beta-phosphoglucomutase-like phosphatase (HAD superfamily)